MSYRRPKDNDKATYTEVGELTLVDFPETLEESVWVDENPYQELEMDKPGVRSEKMELMELKELGTVCGFALRWIKKGLKKL